MPTETTLNNLKVHKVPDFETWEENYNQANGIGTSDVVVMPPEELKKGVLPDQTNNSGKFLTTDGNGNTSWATVDALPPQAENSGKFLTTNGAVASWSIVSIPSAADATPLMDNATAAVGTSTDYAREDHVHPSDTSKADKNHASTSTNYGIGTTNNYGHVKLSDSTSSTTAAASGGTAATPAAVKAAYDLANGKYNKPSSGIPKTDLASGVQTSLGLADTALQSSAVGANSGVAPLNASGKIDSTYLPSYVDDVIEGYYYNSKFYTTSAHTTEITGETGKIFVDLSTNKTYRYGGSSFTEISQGSVVSVSRDLTSGTKIGTLTINGTGTDLYAPTPETFTVTGGASTIVSDNLTANRALISNTNGKVAVSDVTSTELGYLDGVTSAIQTQINDKQAKITASGLLKGDGSGGVSAATAGTDYQAPLPSQTNNSGKFLTTNNSTLSWGDVPEGVFIAECYVTTFAEIKTAYDAGKTIFLYWDWDGSRAYNEYAPLTEFYDSTKVTGGSTDEFTFNLAYPDIIYSFSCYDTTPTTWEQTSKNLSHVPTNHSTAATTYGKGTDSYYGHVRLSDSTSSTSSTSDGIAATPAAVKTAYDLAVARTKIYTATCSTAAATAAKVATLDDSTGFSLTAGVTVAVRFTYGNSATTPTLRVDGSTTGTAKTIAIPSSTTAFTTGNGTTYNTWGVYETIIFTYNGTYWVNTGSALLEYLSYDLANAAVPKTVSGAQGNWSSSITNSGDITFNAYDSTEGSNTLEITPNSTTIHKVVTPTANGDAVPKSYVDNAISNIDALPSQTGNSGKYLTTDGTAASWGDSVSGSLIDTENVSEISIDTTPTQNSTNLITSGGVYSALQEKVFIATSTASGGTFSTTNAEIDAALEDGKICFYDYYGTPFPLIGRYENPDTELIHIFLGSTTEVGYEGQFIYIFCTDNVWSIRSFTAVSDISPTFYGTPKAPTAAAGTNTTQIATTAFVNTELNRTNNVNAADTSYTTLMARGEKLLAASTFDSATWSSQLVNGAIAWRYE